MHPKSLKAVFLTLIIFGLLFLVNRVWKIPDFENKAWIFVIAVIIIANIAAHIWHEKSQKKK